MSANKHALKMLTMARKDLKSLRHMLEPEEHDEEVFGFHAQQAIEKSLKAWLIALGVRYNFTHDLKALFNDLRAADADVAAFSEMHEFTEYAVQFRYDEWLDGGEELDRDAILLRVEDLFLHVSGIVNVHAE